MIVGCPASTSTSRNGSRATATKRWRSAGSLALARAALAAAIGEKPAARFMIRSRTRVVCSGARLRMRAGADGRNEARTRPYNLLISRDEAFYNRRKLFRHLSQYRSSIHPEPLPNAFLGNPRFIAIPVQIVFGEFPIGKTPRYI